jgi:hypothetical protein
MNLQQAPHAEDAPNAQLTGVGEVIINDETPLSTADLRGHPVFTTADPAGLIPDVTLGSAPLNPRDRPHRNETRVGIYKNSQMVGAFNLAQLPSGTAWIRDVRIDPEKRGGRLGVATYLGVIAAAHEVGRQVQSDPAGLSPEKDGESPARRVWESLVRRGVAEVVEGRQGKHGNPMFISRPPETDRTNSSFDRLQENAAIDATLQMFQDDRLLARAMDGPLVTADGLDFGVVNEELAQMAGGQGMAHVSTTLLIPGAKTRVYKQFGFLADSDSAVVEHVAEGDSSSHTDNNGNLRAHETSLVSLAELAQVIRDSRTTDMNEVNVTLRDDALRGLFAADYATPKLDALVTQRHIQELGRGTLPLFIYDVRVGSLRHWAPTLQEVTALLDAVAVAGVRAQYAKVLLT